jgi:hypothetical protein
VLDVTDTVPAVIAVTVAVVRVTLSVAGPTVRAITLPRSLPHETLSGSGRGRHSFSRRADGPGHHHTEVLAHETLACTTGPKLRSFFATRVATLARVIRCIAVGRVAGHEASRDPEVASSFQNVPRPKRPR